MLLYSISILILAAIIGFIMIYIGYYHHRKSLTLVICHILFAVTGLALLLYHITRDFISLYNIAAALLLMLTLVVGAILAAISDGRKPPPLPAIIVHAVTGLGGISLLLIGSYQAIQGYST